VAGDQALRVQFLYGKKAGSGEEFYPVFSSARFTSGRHGNT
jgi:hypothetical protein